MCCYEQCILLWEVMGGRSNRREVEAALLCSKRDCHLSEEGSEELEED